MQSTLEIESSRPPLTVRGTGVLIIEARMSNPNGDPDKESDPRTLTHNGKGVISGVSFKRKLRDLIGEKGGVAWQILQSEWGLEERLFGILEDRGREWANVRSLLQGGKGENLRAGNYQAFHESFWDARVFGNTFLEGAKEEGDDAQKANLRQSVRNGVVQFVNAVSVSPVTIARGTNTKKAGAQEGKDRGMAPLADRVVEHGVYVMPFFVNPALAHRTHCAQQDVDVLLRLIPSAYPLTASRIRPFVEVRHAFYMEHKSPLGSCSDLALVERFTPRRKDESMRNESSTSWDDYTMEDTLGPYEGKVVNFRDLVNG